MSTYTIVGGVNGSGKSSLTGVLKNTVSDLGTIIDVDKITAELNGDMIAGGKEAIHRIEKCIEKSASFTQETTLSGFKTERTVKALRFCRRQQGKSRFGYHRTRLGHSMEEPLQQSPIAVEICG